MKNWTYRGNDFSPNKIDPKEYLGFVYLITCTVTGKKYVGKKGFFFKGKETVILKSGKKKKRRCLVESDWREYFSSSEELKQDVKNLGSENFSREILRLCKSKAETSYFEAKYQFEMDLLTIDSYNKWIMVRVRKDHLKNLS